MTDPRIRLAQVADAAAMPQIEAAAVVLFSDEPNFAEPNLASTWSREHYAALIRKGRSLVAEDDGQIVGFIACEPFGRDLHVWELRVHPERQRQGLGALLLRAVLVDSRASGFHAVTLTTFRDVPWNAPFYAKLGFVDVDEVRVHTRLAAVLTAEVEVGAESQQRIAMIRLLD